MRREENKSKSWEKMCKEVRKDQITEEQATDQRK